MAFAFEFDFEKWIELVVVEVNNLAFGTTNTHLEADKIVKVELVALLLLHLEHKFVVENHLGTLFGVDIGKCHDCTALTTITLPENMLYLGAQAFLGCTSLKEITLPASGITEYSWGMFLGAGLETVTLRDGVEVLPTNIFLGTALTEITIPASVTKIMPGALGGCEQLVRVKFEGNAPVLEDVGVGNMAPQYTVCHHKGAEGFTAPEWDGFAKEIW